jgi:calcium-dependent protein kinase
LEYLKGGSIYDRMKTINRFGECESAYIMKQILQALNYCSKKKIVHRDLKLENILFVNEDQLQVKIVDFGSAISVENYNPRKTVRIITSYYVAPEIITKDEYILKCDVWSSGVILFILLSGSLPFKGSTD